MNDDDDDHNGLKSQISYNSTDDEGRINGSNSTLSGMNSLRKKPTHMMENIDEKIEDEDNPQVFA